MSIIAVFNQKGGVGKTTTALNLLAAIAQRGSGRSASTSIRRRTCRSIFGVQPRARRRFGLQLLRAPAAARRHRADHDERRHAVPGAPRAREARLAARQGRQRRDAAARTRCTRPDALPGPVVIDCCPLLNVLSLNAMFASDLVLVPVSADYLSLQGAEQVERALNALEPVFKRRLPRRYLLTRYDARRRMSDGGAWSGWRAAAARRRSARRGFARA